MLLWKIDWFRCSIQIRISIAQRTGANSIAVDTESVQRIFEGWNDAKNTDGSSNSRRFRDDRVCGGRNPVATEAATLAKDATTGLPAAAAIPVLDESILMQTHCRQESPLAKQELSLDR